MVDQDGKLITENRPPFVPILRLVIQASLPFASIEEAEGYYTILKEQFKTLFPNCTLNGQLIKMFEPCCGQKGQVQYGQVRPQVL